MMTETEKARQFLAFEAERNRLAALGRELDNVPRWLPARGLRDLVSSYETLLDDLRTRFTAKPVVAVVGPTGSGKSTLINALTGRDTLVKSGHDRPTTRDVAVISRHPEDARQVLAHFQGHTVSEVSAPHTSLHHVVLLDTPDTDSVECTRHRPLLEQALQVTDVLLCVFHAHNPKKRDNIEALARWVDTFPGKQVYLIINQWDRIPANELEAVKQDFLGHISRSWTRKWDAVYCLSARAALHEPGWAEHENPLHRQDDFPALKRALDQLGEGAVMVDARLERARHLWASAAKIAQEQIRPQTGQLTAIRETIEALEKTMADRMLDAVASTMDETAGDINVVFYGELAQRWWGPVGIYLQIWRRMVDLWTPLALARHLRLGRLPVVFWYALRAFKNPDRFEEKLGRLMSRELESADMTQPMLAFHKQWPDIADRLVAAGFDPSIREAGAAVLRTDALRGLSERSWTEAKRDAVRQVAGACSRSPYQWLANLPLIAGMALAAKEIVVRFVLKDYLPLPFFLNSAAVLLLLWLVPSWIVQGLVQRKKQRIPALALQKAKDHNSADELDPPATDDIVTEINRLLRLDQVKA